jgi:predicted dehydrogenase
LLRLGAAAAIPTIIPACALGLQNSLAPSNRVNMGFVGTGGQGTQHIAGGPWTTTGGFLARNDAQILAVCDVEQSRRLAARDRINRAYADRAAQGSYEGCKDYADFRELLSRNDIDAVLIATPDHWHALISIEAMKAGKDVYCEKPITLTIREAQTLREAVHRYNRVLQVGTQQRSSASFRRACELVRNGRIGKVTAVHVNVGGTSRLFDAPEEKPPPGFDWDLWLGQAPWRPYSSRIHRPWMSHRDFSGGEMTNWGAHHFDIAQWGLGKDHTGPVEILPPDGREIKQLTYRYDDGSTIHHGGHPNPGVTFIGTEGVVHTDRWFCRTEPAGINKTTIGPDETHLYVSDNHHDNFVECIRTRKDPIAHIDQLSRSISLCHLGNIAYWLNRPLKWDPAKERFVNDEAADRWLSRAQRAPWTI